MVVSLDDADCKMTEQQEARAKLRESFLKAIIELQGEPCKIMTYEKTSLSANFGVLTTCGNEILVRDLETPACVKMTSALLRAPDVLAIQFDRPVLLP